MAANRILSAARRFQFWTYTVSHRQLLLRSPKEHGFATQIDGLFKDVSLMYLETAHDGLSIDQIEGDIAGSPIDVSHVQRGHKLFRLTTNTNAGFVAAAAFFSSEDDKEYYDESPLVAAQHM